MPGTPGGYERKTLRVGQPSGKCCLGCAVSLKLRNCSCSRRDIDILRNRINADTTAHVIRVDIYWDSILVGIQPKNRISISNEPGQKPALIKGAGIDSKWSGDN